MSKSVVILGYLLEILFLSNDDGYLSFETTFYLTHMDIAIGNTFITTSGFIILLLTIDRLETIKEKNKNWCFTGIEPFVTTNL